MTLKNSFLVRLNENNKRRLWLYVVSILLFVVALPIYTAMNISMIQAWEKEIGIWKMQQELYDALKGILAFNSSAAYVVCAALFAVLSGMQGFSYLYDRNKIDFYHSKPVKSSQRFVTIWLNGFLAYALPFVVGNAINLVLAAGSGVLDFQLTILLGQAVLLSLGYYLCVYSVVILAVMLTGKPLITIFGTAVFLFYEMLVRVFLWEMCSFSFHFFYNNDVGDWTMPRLSPFYALNAFYKEEAGVAITLLKFGLFALIVLCIAYWCYKKRPSELAGSAITFQGIKPFIKIGIAVPSALAAGMITAEIMDYDPLTASGSPFFPILIGSIFVVVVNALIQVIFESDIRAMLHKKRDILISAGLTLVIMLAFRYDFFGYDARMPETSEIEYVSLITDARDIYSRSFYDLDGTQMRKGTYTDKYMKLTGEDLENVRALALYSIEKYQEFENRADFYENVTYAGTAVYKFHLKNGRVMTREIPVILQDAAVRSLLGKIEDSEEYIKCSNPAMTEYFYDAVQNHTYPTVTYWGNEILSQKLTDAQTAEFLKRYREDVLKTSYEEKCRELPLGKVEILLKNQVSSTNTVVLPIYAVYSNCMAFLKENGFETENMIDVSEVDYIRIARYYESDEEWTETYTTAGFSEITAVAAEEEYFEVDYINPAQLQTIVDNAYPVNMEFDYWMHLPNAFDSEYIVYAYFKEGSSYYEQLGAAAQMTFKNGCIPEFVYTDLPLDNPPQK